jgi:type I restriction enzyme S subunit
VNVPKLRFNEFYNDWEYESFRASIDLLTDYHANGAYEKLKEVVELKDTEDYAVMIRTTNLAKQNYTQNLIYIDEKAYGFLSKSKVYPDDLIINKIANAGATYLMPDLDRKVSLGMNLFLVRINSSNDPKFKYYSIKKNEPKLKSLASGTSTKTITKDDVRSFKLHTPTLPEQKKIAVFISTIDKRINQLKEKKALLDLYKKGVIQKLLSQEIRFKDENGNDFPCWENNKFEKVFERVAQKNKEDNQNVLTISAQRGLINQQKYFNKSVSAKDVTGYYLLKNGDFAYNKSYSKGYPMGAIKRLNNYDKGVVSTLYICFKSHGDQHDKFWEQYFEAGLLNREIGKIAQEGARNHGLLNVSVTEFFRDITVHAPSEKEQIRIAEFLCTLDKKLELVSQQIKQTQAFKKGLLQQMFV